MKQEQKKIGDLRIAAGVDPERLGARDQPRCVFESAFGSRATDGICGERSPLPDRQRRGQLLRAAPEFLRCFR